MADRPSVFDDFISAYCSMLKGIHVIHNLPYPEQPTGYFRGAIPKFSFSHYHGVGSYHQWCLSVPGATLHEYFSDRIHYQVSPKRKLSRS